MTMADLLFICCLLATLATLLAAAIRAASGQRDHALGLLKRLGLGVVVYFIAIIAVSLAAPQRVFHLGDPQCFDDWCVTVEQLAIEAGGSSTRYAATLRLSSRARRVAQRENNLAVYLTDDRGRRFNPLSRGTDVPFNVLLQPGESVEVSREFDAPADAHDVGLIIAHEGGFPIGWFIIGYDTWFRKHAVVRADR